MKKLLSIALAVLLFAGVTVTGTVAYLTSEDSDVNVMTLGNVKIEQIEQEWNADETKLQPFTQGKPLYPYVGTLGWENEDKDGGAYRRFTMENVVDKYVSVKNTGRSDAYVRTIIALEMGSFAYTEFTMIGASTNMVKGAEFQFPGAWVWTDDIVAEIDGHNYNIMVAVHQNPVAPGETTIPSLNQIYLKSDATNEDVEALDGNNNGTYDILVLSQAVQTAGFDKGAEAALDEAFGDVDADKVKAWFDGMGNVQFIAADEEGAAISGEEAEAVLNDLESGKYLVVDEKVDIIEFAVDASGVDAKGATVNMNGTGADAFGYLAFIPEVGKNTTVSNLNVTGSGFVEVGHYGVGGGTYEVNNLTIKDLAATLSVKDSSNMVAAAFAHYGTATLNNCVITGTTNVQDGYTPYDIGCVNKTTTTINGGQYGKMYIWSQAHVTINNAKVGTIDCCAITKNNLGMLTIGAGAKVDTINLICLDQYSPALTIEDGASVGEIVYKGVSYTQEEWKTANP